jgi:hypothetical protein
MIISKFKNLFLFFINIKLVYSLQFNSMNLNKPVTKTFSYIYS